MFKTIFYVIGLGSLLLSACAKEEIHTEAGPAAAPAASKTSAVVDKGGGGPPMYKIWFDNHSPNGTHDIDYGCRDLGGNCLSDIVVTPGLKADVRGVGQVILHGSAPEIVREFKMKREILEPLVGKAHVEGVIRSALIPEVRGLNDDKIYMIFKNRASSKILIVFEII